MNNSELMPTELLRRVKDLKKAGYKVTYESSEADLVKLNIRKASNKDQEPFFFY